jgi:hypothetical protein
MSTIAALLVEADHAGVIARRRTAFRSAVVVHRASPDHVVEDLCQAATDHIFGDTTSRAQARVDLWHLGYELAARTVEDELRQLIMASPQALDTTTAAGRAMFLMIAVFGEFERNLIRERTKAGLAAARAQGRRGGRKRRLNDDQVRAAHTMVDQGQTVAHVARVLQVSDSTLHDALTRARGGAAGPPAPERAP